MKTLGWRLWHSPTFTTWGSLGVRLASVVLLLPFVLVRFSPEEVAVWQLITALFMLGLILDYALAPTFTRLMSYARAGLAPAQMGKLLPGAGRGAVDTAAADASMVAVFGTMRWLYPRLAVLVLALLSTLGTWGLVTPINHLSHPAAAWLAWCIVLISFYVALWGGCYSAALQGMDSIAPVRRWEIAFGAVQVSNCLVVLWLGGGLLQLIATYQVWTVIGVLRNRFLLSRLHPALTAAPRRPDPAVLDAARSPAWRSLAGVLFSQGVIQFSGIYYAQTLPAAEVASYLLGLRLIMIVSQFSQAPFYTKLPNMAQLHAAGQPAAVLRAAASGMRRAHWVFAAGAVLAALVSPWMLGLVHSRTAFLPAPTFALLALAFWFERLGAMHIQLYSLTNHVLWHIANGVTGLSMCLITVVLVPVLGLMAFPLAMALSYLGFYCPFALIHSRRAFVPKLWRFERGVSVGPLALLLFGLGAGQLLPLAH